MNTPRMQEAWDKSSRTADGFYSSQTPTSEYATSCYDEGCKLERELAYTIRQRDEARGQRDRMAEALQKVVTAWDLAEWLDENDFESFRATLQSLNPNEPISK